MKYRNIDVVQIVTFLDKISERKMKTVKMAKIPAQNQLKLNF